METVGRLAPEDPEAARSAYEELETPASTVTKAVVGAVDRELVERVDEDVRRTGRDALFGSLLAVQVGTRAEYDEWREQFDGDVSLAGSDGVDHVAWHSFDGAAVAATFQNERDAAVDTLRRQAFNRLYREHLYESAGARGNASQHGGE